MATYESRFVKGWRTRLEESGERLAREMWNAPSQLEYIEGTSSADGNALLGHTPWFQRIYGPEREAAKTRFAEHLAEKKRIRKAEETEDQREQRRERQRHWRANLSPEQVEKYKVTALARIARQEPEWHAQELEKRRQRKNAKRDEYNATDRLSAQSRSNSRNAKKREVYAMNPDYFCEKERARRAANPEHVRAMARAAYARRKLNRLAPD